MIEHQIPKGYEEPLGILQSAPKPHNPPIT